MQAAAPHTDLIQCHPGPRNCTRPASLACAPARPPGRGGVSLPVWGCGVLGDTVTGWVVGGRRLRGSVVDVINLESSLANLDAPSLGAYL